MRHARQVLVGAGLVISLATAASATVEVSCEKLPTDEQLRKHLSNAANGTGIHENLGPNSTVGGFADGKQQWGAVVNRNGELCAFTTSTPDPTQPWPGSQAVAKAKAYTANAFSNDDTPLPTARLYTLTQPGHSLFGLQSANPFNPRFLAPPSGNDGGRGQITGGTVTFGGGVPLYRDGKIVGGLGVSGDSACADHEIAKRARDLAGLNPPGGPLADDIIYKGVDEPSLFAHPLCANTKRNGVSVGEETP